MGAYLSAPVVDKVTEDGLSDKFVYGAASMQGWRKHQEDAHIVIILPPSLPLSSRTTHTHASNPRPPQR